MRNDKYPHFQVEGGAFDVGLQYGRLARDRIFESLDIYRRMLSERAAIEWAEALRIAGGYVSMVQGFDPSAIDEVRGIAEGAGASFEDMMVLNCHMEILNQSEHLSCGCTTVGLLPEATIDRHTILGQNDDEIAACGNTVVLLEIQRKDGLKSFNFVEAGMVPTNGMNSAGIGVVGNTLGVERVSGRAGIPFAFQRRKILGSMNICEAMKVVAQAKSSSPHNHLIGTAEGFVIDMEANFDEFYPLLPEDGMVAHANHFVSPRFQGKDMFRWRFADSLYRDWRMRQILMPLKGKISIDHVKNAFMDHFGYPQSICRHPENHSTKSEILKTVGSIIMDLTAGEIHIAPGCPCESEYKVYRLGMNEIKAEMKK